MDEPTTDYDNCGMYTYWRDEVSTVIPSDEWSNAYDFFAEVKPPYFENYEIVIRTDDCFNVGVFRVISIGIWLILAY